MVVWSFSRYQVAVQQNAYSKTNPQQKQNCQPWVHCLPFPVGSNDSSRKSAMRAKEKWAT